MTNRYCAGICYAYLKDAVDYDGVIFAGSQVGSQCWCGGGSAGSGHGGQWDFKPNSACNAPCTGAPSEKCGGQYLNTVTKIDCTTSGWTLVLGLLLGGFTYLGAGIMYGTRTRGGAMGLTKHPHYQQFLSLQGLVADGVAFARGKQHGQGSLASCGYVAVHTRERSRKHSSRTAKAPQNESTRGSKKSKKEAKERTVDKEQVHGQSTALLERAAATPAPTAAGTAAGDGGRESPHHPLLRV
eukprot:COSAG02_NODE_5916_length_3941_cov_2.224362_3_plen_241_part_00